jgi:hypothetical protein
VTLHSGKVLDAPEVYTVVWQGDEAAGAKLDQFRGAFLESTYLPRP